MTILETCGFAFSYILKIYIATGQALYDDFLLKFFYLSVVHDGVQFGVFREHSWNLNQKKHVLRGLANFTSCAGLRNGTIILSPDMRSGMLTFKGVINR